MNPYVTCPQSVVSKSRFAGVNYRTIDFVGVISERQVWCVSRLVIFFIQN